MGDESERLHLEGLDEATERERWEEHHTGRMTDLPDAVVEAAANGIGHDDDCGPERTPSGNCWCGSVGTARAALAAASGPWAEQLDAATAEHERVLQGVKDCWKVDMKDAREQRDRAEAALARNAELERELGQWKDRMWVSVRERAVWSHEAGEHAGDIPFLNCPLCESSALRAELDNLRDRVTALADKWQDSEFRRKQPVLAYVGLDVAARDLTADREVFDREVARKGAEVGRMNAAIVRGSDDEAGACTCGESVPTVTTPGPCYWAENAPGVQSQVHCPPPDGVNR